MRRCGSLKSKAVSSQRDKHRVSVRVRITGASDEDAKEWAERRLGIAL
jgi:hypothetical protein